MLIYKRKAQNPDRVVEDHGSRHGENAKGVVLVVLDGKHFVESTFLISAISEFLGLSFRMCHNLQLQPRVQTRVSMH